MTRGKGIGRLGDEQGLVGWLIVLIILGAIFALWLIIQLLQAIF